MKTYVTADNFDEHNVVFKPIEKHTQPVPYQRIDIKYMYDGEEKPLLIKTHRMFSFGVLENKDPKTGETQNFSMPFVTYDVKEGKTEQDEKFIEMIETITRLCKNNVIQNQESLKKKPIDIESLCLLKTRKDNAPAMFVKLRTRYGSKPIEIETSFKKKSKSGITSIKTLDMIRKKCMVIGAIRINSIFIGSHVTSVSYTHLTLPTNREV